MDIPVNNRGNKKICYPIAKRSGQEFTRQEEILAHLAGESTGLYMIGRNGMWHGGIHITHATTPWCALSGKAASEKTDFPLAYKGERAVRCMVDGDVVAYRICKDYMQIKWSGGPLHCSGSFVLVRHYIQPGESEKSGLHFYTLYMHLAPYSAYESPQQETLWVVQDRLAAWDPEWVMVAGSDNATARNTWRRGTLPKGAIVEWDQTDTNLHATAWNHRGYGLVTFRGLGEEAQKRGAKSSLTPGQRYWILVDKNNISPLNAGATQPCWWRALLPPAREVMKFDQVVCPDPFAISAGDSVGHLGYFQAAKDYGYEARYQVHIECISMDDNLPAFLTNPDKAGGKDPLWLKYSPDMTLYGKDIKTGTFAKDGRSTARTGILRLDGVSAEADSGSGQEYWRLAAENGYLPKGEGGPELLSQYDLAKLGFRTEISEPESFDYLNGKKQPQGLVRNLFQALLNAAKDDTRVSHALVPYNYQRLLYKIDSGEKDYSPLEYLSALHNPSYRDVVLKTIVKHPSDWYHKKGDAIWQTFLAPLKKDDLSWHRYSEEFLDKMAWMQEVTTERLGPSLWHMHPVMFLGALLRDKKRGWAHSPFANFLGEVESRNDYTAYNVTKAGRVFSHYNSRLTSMSILEVMSAQKNREMFATGRFQIIPLTLKNAVNFLNLNKTDLYNEATQDYIFENFLIKIKRPAFINYLEGAGDIEDAIYEWAKEFASAGVKQGRVISPKIEFAKDDLGGFIYEDGKKKIKVISRTASFEGESYYSGDGYNKASVMPREMIKVLKESKDESY